jgi:hypothetical protein
VFLVFGPEAHRENAGRLTAGFRAGANGEGKFHGNSTRVNVDAEAGGRKEEQLAG